MWKKYDEGNPPGSAETVTAYEQAMKEFATSATEFLEHIQLLTKARDAYQRAVTISSQLRSTLDRGDEILRTLMAQVDQAVNVERGARRTRREQARSDESRDKQGECGKS